MSKVFDYLAHGNPADRDAAEREYASIALGNHPTIVHRDDGWYVEASDGMGVASAGPMSEDVARELLAEVEADIASAYEQEAHQK
ncbi:hypothetical protein [Pseudorhodoplanes sinuspersici]|uniref:Uncharacterized protein n=1 Tax=Pseudorhodoplanes sinuspersici TaxID=1235591 RepID=A0A1W6ZN99_9HYPH|nr:hypothetical protein [Pseudorhodoplanes sinuspersici]ARP98264.1 hypothetical protein CAK95_03520 [Pseudorhodoplanes sinuspersici]